MTQFDRHASLNIFTPGSTGFFLTGLRITFNVTKTSDPAPNTAQIQVYNLSENTRSKISDAFNEKTQKIHLNAGYTDGDVEELFNGDVTKVTHNIQPPNIVTTIEANDGQKALAETKVKLSFDAGASVKKIFKQVVDAFPLDEDVKNIIVENEFITNFTAGFSFSGPARDAMDLLSKTLNMEWSIQNGQMIVVPMGGNDGTRVALIDQNSGLIGSPERLVNDEKKATGKVINDPKKAEESTRGWKFNCLLRPAIKPLGQVSLKSIAIPKATFFTVDSVVHVGDTHGQPWGSAVEVKE